MLVIFDWKKFEKTWKKNSDRKVVFGCRFSERMYGSKNAVCCSIIEDQETSGDVDRGSNGWIIGSQGCPLLSSSETTLQEVPDAPLSPASTEDQAKNEPKSSDEGERDSAKPEVNEDGGHDEEENSTKREDGIQDENKKSGQNDDDGGNYCQDKSNHNRNFE